MMGNGGALDGTAHLRNGDLGSGTVCAISTRKELQVAHIKQGLVLDQSPGDSCKITKQERMLCPLRGEWIKTWHRYTVDYY